MYFTKFVSKKFIYLELLTGKVATSTGEVLYL